MASKAKGKATRSNLYRSYVFKDKDPIIDLVRTVVQESEMSYGEISDKSGVSTSAINGWLNGATLRPQFCTANAVFRSCGYTLVPVRYKVGK